MRHKPIPYNPKLKEFARYLRKNGTLAEILLWNKIQGEALGVAFKRQVPVDDYIVDFFCHELMLVIEVDGYSHDFKYEYDQLRQNKLEDLGFKIIRFGDQQVKNDMFNVLRVLEITIGKLKAEKTNFEARETTSPLPPPKGEPQNTPKSV
jgi:very-short-patch-repair endonuclease